MANEPLEPTTAQRHRRAASQASAVPTVRHSASEAGDTPPPLPPRDDLSLAATSGRYAARELLGRGGMGEVIGAWDTRLDRDVALKRIVAHVQHQPTDVRGELLQRFEREARITGQLDHPNVVPVHDLGIGDDGLP